MDSSKTNNLPYIFDVEQGFIPNDDYLPPTESKMDRSPERLDFLKRRKEYDALHFIKRGGTKPRPTEPKPNKSPVPLPKKI